MAAVAFMHFATPFSGSPSLGDNRFLRQVPLSLTLNDFSRIDVSISQRKLGFPKSRDFHSFVCFSGDGGSGDGYGGTGGGGDGDDHGDEDAEGRNRGEAFMVLAEAGRSLDSIPKDLAASVEAGKIPGAIIRRFFDLEKSPFLGWLLQFGGFKERLLADDLFLTKVAIECGVGIFTKTAAELERRRENFFKELDFVIADVIMAIIADFMLVWLPAPTVSLKPPLAIKSAGFDKFFYGWPDNAFQVALPRHILFSVPKNRSYFEKWIKAVCRWNKRILGITNLLIAARKAFDETYAVEAEDVPILSTSLAYGVYMAVSSNLRYQVLAGVIEQRILEPLLHEQKVLLGILCFAVRTGNTFLGSLMWVDYARWIGIQKIRE